MRVRHEKWQSWFLAAAVAAAFAGSWWFGRNYRTSDDPLTSLINAANQLDYRIVAGRLSNFSHRPWLQNLDDADGLTAARILRLRGAAAKLLSLKAHVPRPRARGLAAILAGDLDQAVDQLELATRNTPKDVHAWNDLAVALIERGRSGDSRSLIRAVVAARRALMIDSRFAAGRFNLAVAMAQLHLRSVARAEFEAAAIPEEDSGWFDETCELLAGAAENRSEVSTAAVVKQLEEALSARDDRRLRDIVGRFRQQSRGWAEVEFLADWASAHLRGDAAAAASRLEMARSVGLIIRESTGDALLRDAVGCIESASRPSKDTLAHAHLLYRRARRLQHAREPGRALPLFRAAALRFCRTGSPMQPVTNYWIANCLTDQGETEDALRMVRTIARAIPADYRSLRGLLAWQEGTVLNSFGFDAEALTAYERALAEFEQIGDHVNTVAMQSAVAAMHANLGRDAEAWRHRLDAFEGASASGNANLLQTVLHTAARTEALAGRFDAAHALFVMAADLETSNRRLNFDSTLWSALCAHRTNWGLVAERYLALARTRALHVTDAGLRSAVENDLRFASAAMAGDSTQSIALWDTFISDAVRRNDTFLLPQAYAERGRKYRAIGKVSEAARDLSASLEFTESRGRRVRSIDFRDSFFATRADVARELIDLVDRQAGPLAALHVHERWRSSIAPVRPEGMSELDASRLSPDCLIAVYIALDDRLLSYAITSKETRSATAPVGRRELAQMADSLAVSAQRKHYDRELASRLHRLLIEPLRLPSSGNPTLIVVADPAIDPVPFSALVDPRGRYLAEGATCLFAITASDAAKWTAPVPAGTRPAGACVAGNPAFDRDRFSLYALPSAEREAADVARLYATRALVRAEATSEAIVSGILTSEIVHIATHSVTNTREPSDSFLLVAPSAGTPGGTLSFGELAGLDLRHVRVAVVASCRSAKGAESGLMFPNLASAFIAAGAHNAIGSLWDLDDSSTRRIALELHRCLIAGMSPPAAVRAVQLTEVRSSDSRRRSPAAWASLRIYSASR